MSANTFPFAPFFKFTDKSGNTAANGTIWTYYHGTQNAAITYTNVGGSANQTNPISIPADGIITPTWGDTTITYDVYVYDSSNTLIQQYNGYSPGSGLLVGVMLTAGNQTATGPFALQGTPVGIGPDTLAQYASGIGQAVIGGQTANVGLVEIIGSKFANADFTKTEGNVNCGIISYDIANAKFNFVVSGLVVATFSATSVLFPDASTFLVNGASVLTSSSVVPISAGGTGQTSAPSALLALAPSTTNNTGNALVVTGANAIGWQRTTGSITSLNAPVSFFNGTSQGSWTTFNVASGAGVPVTANGVIIESIGWFFQSGPNIFNTSSPPGPLAYACGRSNTSYGNDTSGGIPYPSSNTQILAAVDLQNAGDLQGSGCTKLTFMPIGINGAANGTFQYIVPTYGGTPCWVNLQLRIVGYY